MNFALAKIPGSKLQREGALMKLGNNFVPHLDATNVRDVALVTNIHPRQNLTIIFACILQVYALATRGR